MRRTNLRDFSSSCSAAVFGTERVFIDRRVTGAVDDWFFAGSVDEDGRSCWLIVSFSGSSLISSFPFRFGLILFDPKLLLIGFFGEK
jgi:hypothetical protein